MTLQVKNYEAIGDIVVLYLEGTDGPDIKNLAPFVDGEMQGRRGLVMDMTDVTSMSPAGASDLQAYRLKFHGFNGEAKHLVLASVPMNIQDVLTAANFDPQFQIWATVKDAVGGLDAGFGSG